jgi:hypothetical protein
LELDHPTGRDASRRPPKSGAIGTLSVGKREDGYDELLANIRRLTVMVLDNLEAGSRDRTLDQGQKRLLSSTGARLLRLWRVVLREGGSRRIAEDLGIIEGLLSTARSVGQEVVQNGR